VIHPVPAPAEHDRYESVVFYTRQNMSAFDDMSVERWRCEPESLGRMTASLHWMMVQVHRQDRARGLRLATKAYALEKMIRRKPRK